eukprot:8185226-Lingulodinium_polyedra.AAC.1
MNGAVGWSEKLKTTSWNGPGTFLPRQRHKQLQLVAVMTTIFLVQTNLHAQTLPPAIPQHLGPSRHKGAVD